LQNEKIVCIDPITWKRTKHFFLSFRAVARNLARARHEISPVGRNDTACRRAFCKNLIILASWLFNVRKSQFFCWILAGCSGLFFCISKQWAVFL